MKALVLVKTEPRSTQKTLSLLPEKVLPVSGRFDAVLIIDYESTRKISDFVLGNVRQIQGVVNTETLITVKEVKNRDESTMPVRAIVMINTNPAKTNSIFDTLSKLSESDMTCMVTGPCDIALFLGTPSLGRLSQILLENVRTIEGVTNTETLLVT